MAILSGKIRPSDYLAMSPEEEEQWIESALNPDPDEIAKNLENINCQIQLYESWYKMSSEEMLRQLTSGELHEDDYISEWLFILGRRDSFEGK